MEQKVSVCLVHDWLVKMRGGEKVLEALCELYPDAPIYTLFYDPSQLSPALRSKDIRASFLQTITGIKTFVNGIIPSVLYYSDGTQAVNIDGITLYFLHAFASSFATGS